MGIFFWGLMLRIDHFQPIFVLFCTSVTFLQSFFNLFHDIFSHEKSFFSKALARMEQLGPCNLLTSFRKLRLKPGTFICISSSENLNLTNNANERNENCLSKLTKTTYKYFEKLLKLYTRELSQWIQNGHKNKKKTWISASLQITCSLAPPFSKKQTGKQTIL